MPESTAIIIPTYNQPEHLRITLTSILRWTKSIYRIYVVDNSPEGYASNIAKDLGGAVTVLKAESNLGWMGGINHGISNSTEPFILMLNDDVRILDFDGLWLQKLLRAFAVNDYVGAVGAASNFVMGVQNFGAHTEGRSVITSALSGFCLLTKRAVIEQVGKLDESLPGGDDLDFSIRLRKAGFCLIAQRDAFVYHYGSLTGNSVYGAHWNSPAYSDAVNAALIRKHGFKWFIETYSLVEPNIKIEPHIDWEHNAMLPYCVGHGADVGCGDRKIPGAIGVDITPGGQGGIAGSQLGRASQADIAVTGHVLPFADGELDYVHARHMIEHEVNLVALIREWVRVLKSGGKIIVAAPDETLCDGIPLDPTHKHAVTLESWKDLLGCVCRYTVLHEQRNDVSFICVVEVHK